MEIGICFTRFWFTPNKELIKYLFLGNKVRNQENQPFLLLPCFLII
jgi:hypothetical protein